MSVLPAPMISITLGGDATEQFLFAEVIPEFSEIEFAVHSLPDIWRFPQGACDSRIRVSNHQCNFFRVEEAQKIGRVGREDQLRSRGFRSAGNYLSQKVDDFLQTFGIDAL